MCLDDDDDDDVNIDINIGSLCMTKKVSLYSLASLQLSDRWFLEQNGFFGL